jgi:multidrug resistance efflux pump
MRKVIIFCMAIAMCSLTSLAQKRADINNLQGEKARIRNGVKTGEITRGEQKRVKNEMHDVRAAKKQAKVDGVVTNAEIKEIKKQDRQLDRTIHRVKNNNRRR